MPSLDTPMPIPAMPLMRSYAAAFTGRSIKQIQFDEENHSFLNNNNTNILLHHPPTHQQSIESKDETIREEETFVTCDGEDEEIADEEDTSIQQLEEDQQKYQGDYYYSEDDTSDFTNDNSYYYYGADAGDDASIYRCGSFQPIRTYSRRTRSRLSKRQLANNPNLLSQLAATTSTASSSSASSSSSSYSSSSHSSRVTTAGRFVDGLLPSPYAKQEQIDYQRAQGEQIQLYHEMKSSSTTRSSSSTTPSSTKQSQSTTHSTQPKKNQLRTIQHRSTRHTTLHHQRITESGHRWTKVLQQRAATKALIAERHSLQPGRMGSNKCSAPSKSHLESLRTEMRSVHSSKRTFNISTGGVRWIVDRRSESSLNGGSSVSSHLRRDRSPVRDSSFESFRRSWYYTHRQQIETSLVNNTRMRAIGIRPTNLDPFVSRAFMSKRSNVRQSKPELSYHGTNAMNHASIEKYGLLIPGRRHPHGITIRVANGSAHGVGIYSSIDANYSVDFHRGGGGRDADADACHSIFVCAVLNSIKGNHKSRGGNGYAPIKFNDNFYIAFEEARIIPLFFLDFAMKSKTQPVQPPPPSWITNDHHDDDDDDADSDDEADMLRARSMALTSKRFVHNMLRRLKTRVKSDGQSNKEMSNTV